MVARGDPAFLRKLLQEEMTSIKIVATESEERTYLKREKRARVTEGWIRKRKDEATKREQNYLARKREHILQNKAMKRTPKRGKQRERRSKL